MKKKRNKTKLQIRKTLLITILVCLVSIILASFIQLTGQSKLTVSCSYFDPYLIDIFAFLLSLFLVIEGFFRIFEHPQASLNGQATRILRIAFGFAILTTHIIQVFNK